MSTDASAKAGSSGSRISFEEVTRNLVAGLTVSFVAISLGAAFGELSGRGATAGILSAGVIALITAAFGGTRIQCSGPTAPMTAVMLTAVGFAYDPAGLAAAVPGADPVQFLNIVLVLAGAALVLMALLRLGRFIDIVPKVVISGFMNGIAVLIWVAEVKKLFALGGKPVLEGGTALNAAIAGVTLALCFLLPRWLKKLPWRMGQFLPGTLVAIVLMTFLVEVSGFGIERVSMGAAMGSVSEMFERNLPRDWSWPVLRAAVPFVLSLAMLAYLDTLLTALVMDKKMKEDRGLDEKTNQDKELAAQGFANAAVAFFGGIPGAQATIRSVLILTEGATLRLAGVAVGIYVLVEMLALQHWIALIPSAVFTGVLFKVGYDVMDWPPLVRFATGLLGRLSANVPRIAPIDMAFVLGTTLVTIVVNLNVAVGVFVVLFYLLRKLGVRVPDFAEPQSSQQEAEAGVVTVQAKAKQPS